MTKVKFYKNDNNIVGFECSGHTGYEEYGKDVLCATISGITQSTVLGLNKVLGIDIEFKRNEKVGLLKVELPKGLSKEVMQQAQVLLNTLFVIPLIALSLQKSQYLSKSLVIIEANSVLLVFSQMPILSLYL